MSGSGYLTVAAGEDGAARGVLPRGQESAADGAIAAGPLMRDFLTWVAGGPRAYTEAMEAWRSSCPRFTIWEDALGDGLISLERGDHGTPNRMVVALTPRGRAALDAAGS